MSKPSPSTSPAPPASAAPQGGPNGSSPTPASKNSRQSLGPSVRPPAGLAPLSPRPQGSTVRPTSELLGNSTSFQTPESEAIDQWFENLQNYEATLEEMAAASLDVNFKEELSAIEQWFRVLSEAERTAALYSLLQHSTQVQIRFFITVLQQMARSDPMTALLSPGMGGSMQAQMEAKLLSMGLKSPALKAPASPSTRNFNTNTSGPANSSSNNFLTPDAALASPSPDAAATLAQQRARLKASNADAASRRISAPGTLSNGGDGRNVWQPPQLGQLAERAPSPVAEQSPPSPSLGATNAIRPKSTDFTGVANQFKNRTVAAAADAEAVGQDLLSPMGGGNWASMVNTPLVPMFSEKQPNLEGASGKLSTWSANKSATSGSANGRIALADAKSFRRTSKGSAQSPENAGVYGDDGNLLVPGGSPSARSPAGNKPTSGSTPGFNQMWPNMQRSPGLSSASSARFGGNDDQLSGGMPFGMGMAGSPLGMSPLMGGMGGMSGMGGMGVGGFNMNMMNLGMGMDPIQAQYLAAQIAAGQFGAQFAAGMQGQGANMMGRGGRGAARMGNGGQGGGGSSGKSASGRDAGNKDKEEEVDPSLLNDVPGWLRSLRLHKYTPNFEGLTWQDMVKMDEEALEARGVAALGARRKMLKTFELVRAKMGIEEP